MGRASLKATFIPAVLSLLLYAPAQAREIVLGLRPAPPYVMQTDAGVTGLEYDIIAAALAEKGHRVTPRLYPFARLVRTFDQNPAIDAAAPVNARLPVTGTLTDPYVTYTNIGLSLAKAQVTADSIADLAALGVVAFQNARTLLGLTFAETVAGNPNYREEANQLSQIKVLFNARTDLIIGERRILYYYIDHPAGEVDTAPLTTEHRLFAPIDYSVVFRDPALAQDFNEGLAALRASGRYDAIMRKY